MLSLHSSVYYMHNLCYEGNAEDARTPTLYCWYGRLYTPAQSSSPLSMHTCLYTYTYTLTCAEIYNTQGLSNSLCCHCSNYLKTLKSPKANTRECLSTHVPSVLTAPCAQLPDFPESGIYSLPLANVSNRDNGQLNCCSQSLAHAVMKLVVLKLWDLVSA